MDVACPVQVSGYDAITIGHGSGGKLTRQLLDSLVFPALGNEHLQKDDDGTVFSLSGRLAISTDSFVVSPIFFPGGDIGDLAVNGTVNDLAMCGAVPRFLSLSFILEEGLPMEAFSRIVGSIREACRQADVNIITGDTKVVERGKGDGIFINTTGIGQVHPDAALGVENIRIGDAIIISGPLARHGIAVMSCRKGLEFETTVISDTRPLHGITQKLIEKFGPGIRLFRDPTRGGVGTVLNEISVQAKKGVHLMESSIPVEAEVAGACEMLGLDPLYVANEGLFIAIVDPEIERDCIEMIRDWEHGAQACAIGSINETHPGKTVIQSIIGGRRVVPMPAGELLPRIC